MNNKQITIAAFLTTKPGKEEELIEYFKTFLPTTRQEPGCVEFHFHQNRQDKHRFVVYENFADQAAFDAHLQAPHTQEFLAYLKKNGIILEFDLWSMLSSRPENYNETL